MRSLEKRLAIAAALLPSCPAAALQVDVNPAMYARAEDQERVRLMETPCTEADLNRRCYRLNGDLIPYPPCAYSDGENGMGFLQVDICYKMEPPRRFKGVWTNAFEGQTFMPEASEEIPWLQATAHKPSVQEHLERALAFNIWIDVSRVGLKDRFKLEGQKVMIEFIGRKTQYPGNYGHMGVSANLIIVDKLISAKVQP
jgi:hypothetical protein